MAIAEVEARDDDDDSIAAADAKPIHEVVFQVDPELGLPPPPPVAQSLQNDLESTTSTLRSVTSSRKSARFFVPHSPPSAMSMPVNLESASTTSRYSLNLTKNENVAIPIAPPTPSDASTAPGDSDLVSITSRNSKISATSRNPTKLSVPPKPPAAMSPPEIIESTTICRNNQRLTLSYVSVSPVGAAESMKTVSESCMAVEEASKSKHCSGDDRADAIKTDDLTNAITNASTLSMSNVSRKLLTAMGRSTRDIRCADIEQRKARVEKNPAAMSGKDFQHNRCEDDKMLRQALLCNPNFDPPAITSIPTDEILDSFTNEPTDNHNSNSSDEELINNIARETRDQYQLGRLQARIDQRRQIHCPITQKEYSPNYKTLRSSRIKTARTLFNHKLSNDCKNSSSHYSGANSEHGSNSNRTSFTPENSSSSDLANKTSSSTIHSLNRGRTIGPSNTSSSSGIHAASISGSIPTLSSQELSAQRSKLYMKMINLLHEVSPNENRNDLSIIGQMLRNENRASRSSAGDAGLIQKLTEDEMSRILNEFEQNNSLIEKKDSVHKSIPASGIIEPSFSKFNIPELMYENIPASIATKLSDVTSEYEKEMSPLAEIEREDVVSSLDAFGSVANGISKNYRHFHDGILHAASMVTDSPMHDDDELLEVISILSQYEEAGKRAKQAEVNFINKELITVDGIDDAPLDDKPNQQMFSCATWLCLQ